MIITVFQVPIIHNIVIWIITICKDHQEETDGKALKISFAIAGATATIVLSALGIKYLSEKGNLPFISPSQIEQEYGEVDIKADTESQKELQEKYDNIKKQLEEAGLDNWEISRQLDEIAVLESDDQDINFFYDSDKDEIVYVYEKLIDKSKSGEVENDKDSSSVDIPADIQEILEAIANNENLTQDEKTYVAGAILDDLIENQDYLDIDELKYRFSILDVNYSYYENGKNVGDELSGSPYERVSGQYSVPHRHEDFERIQESIGEKYGFSLQELLEGQGEIYLFNGNTLEECTGGSEETMTHELRTCSRGFFWRKYYSYK